MDKDLTAKLEAHVRDALTRSAPLRISGGGTKTFLGRATEGEPLDVAGHRGIVNYQPTELVITARAGTPLLEINAALHERNQMLGFEPPHFGDNATLGGTIACGLSGPRRAYAGAARDFVLGMKLINGRGELLHFGGEVMKNVAGYDVSRLMTGAMGTLGVITEVSLKVLPHPASELTLMQACTADDAITRMNQWAGRPLPISATSFVDGVLYARLSGAETAVRSARQQLGGEVLHDAAVFWVELREQLHAFFAGDMPLWRLSLPSAAASLSLDGPCLLEWGGAQRWLRTDAQAAQVRHAAETAGGHAVLFRGGASDERLHPLPLGLMALHQRVKHAFDPKGVFNPGRMYAEI